MLEEESLHFRISYTFSPIRSMAQNVRKGFIAVLATIIFLASFYHSLLAPKPPFSAADLRAPPIPRFPRTDANSVIQEQEQPKHEPVSRQIISRHVTSVIDSINTVSILLPAWEVLVIISPKNRFLSDSVPTGFTCLFPSNASSPGKFAGFLSSPRRSAFKCDFPGRLRRRLPFPQPVLSRSPDYPPEIPFPAPELIRWNYLVYESFSTETDVVLFVKGINHRQGVNRAPSEFRCVFGDDDGINAVKTAVTTSLQEVFRCPNPPLVTSAFLSNGRIKISLEILQQKRIVPSVAYYTSSRKIALQQTKSLICACTMVYNVAKFLKEWVVYYSAIGVEKFILYNNGSDDQLDRIVEELVSEGYNVSTLFWLWPKTQEAGFSHCAISAKDSCEWMIYMDVDEFVYSPSWLNSSTPSTQMLNDLLPESSLFGQILISCYEFGPSNQNSHPELGVTQGYNCRRRSENRHKSIVLLEAIDESLLNTVHHFQLKQGYIGKRLGVKEAVVNHYKFQAWSEFKTKFRRRVSAYVVDWTVELNLASKDRTPGLGSAPVEPPAWAEMFCEVYDEQLKELTRRWFGSESPSGYGMAWQR
ncbi:glycosyltransferase family 92 protein At1g27200-like [Diospyros lotus]|uniref:glycosyltransferase family 92 protein At1g27200-like n=1 Tax=Diospyros lotus TaxID=55363 RepID=UPI00225920F8|nr:glycosyltransferase family 92 protein At1g27200-like [Diospyros lotus]